MNSVMTPRKCHCKPRGWGIAVGSLGVPIWLSHVKDGQSLVVHNVSGSGANLKRLDLSARMVPGRDKAPTSVPEIIIFQF